MKFLVTFRPNWWIIGAIFEEICIYVEENEGFGQPLIPFILLIGELQMGPYMVTYWCVSECCSLIGSHRLYVYRNVMDLKTSQYSTVDLEAIFLWDTLEEPQNETKSCDFSQCQILY